MYSVFPGAIHVINYYRDEVRNGGRQRAPPGRALRHALFPCSLAALTTAIGLGSLYTSNLAPISNFGLYSAIGVIATLAILFSYLPAALQIFVTESKSVSDSSAAGDGGGRNVVVGPMGSGGRMDMPSSRDGHSHLHDHAVARLARINEDRDVRAIAEAV